MLKEIGLETEVVGVIKEGGSTDGTTETVGERVIAGEMIGGVEVAGLAVEMEIEITRTRVVSTEIEVASGVEITEVC